LARDAVQEGLLQIRDGARRFRAPSSDADRAALAWILRVTANAALLLRRRAMRRSRHERAAGVAWSDDRHAQSADDAAMDVVRTALSELPEPIRAAVVLRHIEDQDYSTIAAALGVPVGTAKVRVHRGLAELRRRLGRGGFVVPALAVHGLLAGLPAIESPSLIAREAAAGLMASPASSTLPAIGGTLTMTTIAIGSGLAACLIVAIGIATMPGADGASSKIPLPPTIATSASPLDAAGMHEAFPGLDERVTVQYRDTPVAEVVAPVMELSGIHTLLIPPPGPGTERLTLDMQDVTIHAMLKQVAALTRRRLEVMPEYVRLVAIDAEPLRATQTLVQRLEEPVHVRIHGSDRTVAAILAEVLGYPIEMVPPAAGADAGLFTLTYERVCMREILANTAPVLGRRVERLPDRIRLVALDAVPPAADHGEF
jgi:RNA polymerase sigma factor (sigma-70 family)